MTHVKSFVFDLLPFGPNKIDPCPCSCGLNNPRYTSGPPLPAQRCPTHPHGAMCWVSVVHQMDKLVPCLGRENEPAGEG